MGFGDKFKKFFGSKNNESSSNDNISEEIYSQDETVTDVGQNEDNRNFKYLDELIKSGTPEIHLDSDIILDDGEEFKYATGIIVECDDLTIDGNNHVIDAKNSCGIFKITGTNIRFSNITFKNGCGKKAGAIFNINNAEFENCRFIANNSKEGAGALLNSGQINLKSCSFINNNSNSEEIIKNNYDKSIFNATDVTFKDNISKKSLIGSYGIINLNDCRLINNFSEEEGLIVKVGDIKLDNCKFINNSSNGYAIMVTGAEINNVHFENNTSNSMICIFGKLDGECNMNNCTFIGNTVENNLITIVEGIFKVNNGTFRNNTSKTMIWISEAKSTLSNCHFISNATNSEQLIESEHSEINFLDNTFVNNTSEKLIILNNNGQFKFTKTHFSNHENPIFLNKGKIEFINCVFNENTSNEDYIINNENNAKITLSGGRFSDNAVKNIINNLGELASYKTIFESNDTDYLIFNKNNLILTAPVFRSDGVILNEGHVDAKKLTHEEVEKRIRNEGDGSIEEFEFLNESKSDFTSLNDEIQKSKSKNNGQIFIKLKNNICLENYELDFFEGGIILDDNITIDGNGKTIDAKNRTRIFNITAKNVTLENITFKGGSCINDYDEHTSGGGAIRIVNEGELTLKNCNFINNQSNDDGGAILNNGILNSENNKFIENSSKYNGGAICNNNKLITKNDEYNDNSSKVAGAIYNKKDLIIKETIILKDNLSDIEQPIYNACSTMTPDKIENNCEIIYNTGEINKKHDDVESCFYLLNTLKNSSNIFLEHDIIFDYVKGLKEIVIDDDCVIDGTGHFIDMNNLDIHFKINSNATFKNITFKNSNLISSSLFIIDNSSWENPEGTDITFENVNFLNNRTNNNNLIYSDVNNLKILDSNFFNNYSKKSLIDSGVCKISNSNFINNHSKSDGTILSHPKVGSKFVNKQLLIEESAFNLNSSPKNGIIKCENYDTYKIKNSDFIKNNVKKNGGAVHCSGKSGEINNCRFISNRSENYGGAVFNNTCLKINYCYFKDNASLLGGGIMNMSELKLEHCRFDNNLSNNSGGAIVNHINCDLMINDSIFNNNYSESVAGAIINHGKMELEHSEFNNNRSIEGGAIYNNEGGTFNGLDLKFKNNHASEVGGSISNMCEFKLNQGIFDNNCGKIGGAIYNKQESILNIVNVKFTNNVAQNSGGGLANLGSYYLESCKLIDNHSKDSGGGILDLSDENGEIVNVEFNGNTSGNYGGAIFHGSSSLKIVDSEFTNNSADQSGSINHKYEIEIENCTFKDNSPD